MIRASRGSTRDRCFIAGFQPFALSAGLNHMPPSLSFAAKSSKSARMDHELGIIGAGNMAEAIARGVVQSGVFRANQIIAADVSAARRELFEKQLGIH